MVNGMCVPHAHRFVFRSTAPNGFMQFHGLSSTTHSWSTMVQYSTLLYLRTMEANNALLYPRRTDVCEFMSVVKLFTMAAAAFSKELWYHTLMLCVYDTSRRQIEDIRDTVYKASPHSFIHKRASLALLYTTCVCERESFSVRCACRQSDRSANPYI